MMEKFVIISNAFDTAVVREILFESRPHLVAPVVLLVEGVYNGFLYEAAELAKYPNAWSGIPLPIKHPIENGKPITANDPVIIEEQSVGNLFNVRYDADKARLVGEIWIDIDKATNIAPEVLAAVRGGQRLEVSTGLYFDIDPQSGMWNDQQYDAIARNYRPDHLALLPGGVGACSWSDGCGVRANKKEQKPMVVKENLKNKLAVLWHSVFGARGNEDSHDALWSKLSSAVSSLDTDSWDHWLHEVYDDYIIYQANGDKNPSEVGSAGTRFLYKRSYTVGADEEVVLSDDAQEVKEEKTYVPVGNVANASPKPGNQPKETVTMQNNDATVQALIACERTRFTEEDAEWLKGLSDNQLETLKAQDEPCLKTNDDPPAPKANDDPPAPKANDDPPAPKANDDPPKPITLDSYIDAAPTEVASVLKRAVARDNADKDKLVAALVANERCEFTEEQLKAKDLEELQQLSKLARISVDFGGQGGGSVAANDDEVPEMPPVFEKKKTA